MITMDRSPSGDNNGQQQEKMRWKILIGSTNRPLRCRLDLRYLTNVQIAEEAGAAAIDVECPDGVASSSAFASGPSLVPSSSQNQPPSQMAVSEEFLESPKQFSTLRPPWSQMDEFTKSVQEQLKINNELRRNAIFTEDENVPQFQCPLCTGTGVVVPMGQQQIPPCQQQIPMGQQQIPMGQQIPVGQQQIPMGQQQIPMGQQQISMNQQQIFNQSVDGGQQSPSGFGQTTHTEEIVKQSPIPNTKPDPPFMEGLIPPPKPEPPWPPRPCPANAHILQHPTQSVDMEPADSGVRRPPPPTCKHKGPDKPKVCCKKKKSWCIENKKEEDFEHDKNQNGNHQTPNRHPHHKRLSSDTPNQPIIDYPVDPIQNRPHYTIDLERLHHKGPDPIPPRHDDKPPPPPPNKPKPARHSVDRRKPPPDPKRDDQVSPHPSPSGERSAHSIAHSSSGRIPSRTKTASEPIVDKGPFMAQKQTFNYSIM